MMVKVLVCYTLTVGEPTHKLTSREVAFHGFVQLTAFTQDAIEAAMIDLREEVDRRFRLIGTHRVYGNATITALTRLDG